VQLGSIKAIMQIILEKREPEEAAEWILTNILKNSPILYRPVSQRILQIVQMNRDREKPLLV
jgi:hypothetical protein